jgi:hypothetical protein
VVQSRGEGGTKMTCEAHVSVMEGCGVVASSVGGSFFLEVWAN